MSMDCAHRRQGQLESYSGRWDCAHLVGKVAVRIRVVGGRRDNMYVDVGLLLAES